MCWADRLYNYILFYVDGDDSIRAGTEWAHERLTEALNIQANIIRNYETACGKIPELD